MGIVVTFLISLNYANTHTHKPKTHHLRLEDRVNYRTELLQK